MMTKDSCVTGLKASLDERFARLCRNRIDYRNAPHLLDAAQNTVNEVALYYKSKEVIKQLLEGRVRPIEVIDFCTGTGLFSAHIVNAFHLDRLICVDADREFLNIAAERLSAFPGMSCEFYAEDAVNFKRDQKVDLILMGSAYHHIEDEMKLQFLSNARELLKPDGYILVSENFLPPYAGSIDSYREAVYSFYSSLIRYLQSVGTPDETVDVMRQVAWFGQNGYMEYKVSYEIFEAQAIQAGLQVVYQSRVWPDDFPNDFPNKNVGSCVVVLMPENQSFK